MAFDFSLGREEVELSRIELQFVRAKNRIDVCAVLYAVLQLQNWYDFCASNMVSFIMHVKNDSSQNCNFECSFVLNNNKCVCVRVLGICAV